MKPRSVLAHLAALAAAGFLGTSCDPWWDYFPTGEEPRYCDATKDCTDPMRPYCDAVTHGCVAAPVDGGSDMVISCSDSTNCPPDRPVCDAAHTCQACKAHSECSSGACLPNGSCAPVGEVAFVNNASCTGIHTGSSDDPYCQIKDALPLGIPVKPFVVVAGSGVPYDGISIATGTVTILGPRPSGSSQATITPALNGQDAVKITDTAAVHLDTLDIANAGNGGIGVNCSPASKMAELTVTRSAIRNNSGGGVSSTNCTINLEADTITSNAGGGVSATSSTIALDANTIASNPGGGVSINKASKYTLTNNIIAHNNGVVPAVMLDETSAGTFAFNTVASNTVSGSVGGIDCGTNAMYKKTIERSIVWGNSTANNTQFGQQCILLDVVTGTADSQGTLLDPTFLSQSGPDAFHLMANDSENDACCVNKIPNPTTPNADHDVDLNRRPLGAGWDIGAHEVQ